MRQVPSGRVAAATTPNVLQEDCRPPPPPQESVSHRVTCNTSDNVHGSSTTTTTNRHLQHHHHHQNQHYQIEENLRCYRKLLGFGGGATSHHHAGGCHTLSHFLLVATLLIWGLILCPLAMARQNLHQTCPGCPHQQHAHSHRSGGGGGPGGSVTGGAVDDLGIDPDDLRLEAIKHQILSKLGLRSRPDVNRTLATVPKRLALETIYRAEAQQPAGGKPPAPPPRQPTRTHHHQQQPTRYDDDNNYDNRNHIDRYADSFGGNGDDYYRNGDDLEGNGMDAAGNGQNLPYPDPDYDDLYGPSEPEVVDDFYARTSEIITFAEPGRTLNGQPLLEFPLSGSEQALEPLLIKKATLWVRVEQRHPHHYQHHRVSPSSQKNITLWVFRVRCGNVTHLRGKELGQQHLEMVTSLAVGIGQLGWQKFDVTRIIAAWYQTFNHHKEKLTLLVDCTGCGNHVHISTFSGHSPHVIEPSLNSKSSPQDPDRPFLVVRTDPTAVKRVRRRAIECTGAVKGQCCKQRFYVSFTQLGWDDWIIAPQGYYANYCRGDCAAGHRTPDTYPNYYTHVIEEYRKMDRLAGMQPCCAPLKFSPMSLIYYGPDSNIIKRDLPKMVVDECGCP